MRRYILLVSLILLQARLVLAEDQPAKSAAGLIVPYDPTSSWTAIAAIVALFAAIASIYITRKVAKLQIESAERIADRQNSLNATLAAKQGEISKEQTEISKRQLLLSQRQNLLPLWSQLDSVRDIDLTLLGTEKFQWDRVNTLANSLELIALCYEADVVDKTIIRRTFATQYVRLYEKVMKCIAPSTSHASGPELMENNHAATDLYNELKALIEEQRKERERLAEEQKLRSKPKPLNS